MEVRISNKESHTNLTDCQKDVLMLHCLPSDSAAMKANQPTERQLTPRLRPTALQGHEARGSFCPMLNDALRSIMEHQSPNVSRNKAGQTGVSHQIFRILKKTSLKGINPHTHSVSRPEGRFTLSQRKPI